MNYKLFDYVDTHERNLFKEWTEDLQKPQRAQLNEKLDKLAMHGDTLYPEMLAGTKVPGISKLKVKGKVQLRPLLCKGPVDIHGEYTLLMGAKEIGDEWSPEGAPKTANGRKALVKADPTHRRKRHERVS